MQHFNQPDFVADRLAQIRSRIADAAARVGRDAAEIRLLPVSKTFGVDAIREAVMAGERRFGENKAQEIRDKYDALADASIEWVMIGHLQTNKAKDVARLASEVQSLDRQELAVALDRRLQLEGRAIDVLVQVKTSDEPSKFGMAPQDVADFLRFLARDTQTLRVKGLMTMAVNDADQDAVRRCFRNLRLLRDELRDQGIDGVALDRLSMGMSGDFAIAIEEGSTEIRVGTAIFGRRSYAEQAAG